MNFFPLSLFTVFKHCWSEALLLLEIIQSFDCLDGWKLWRKLSFLVAVPGVALCMLNVYLGLDDKEAHEPPPFVAYEHLRLRNKASFTVNQLKQSKLTKCFCVFRGFLGEMVNVLCSTTPM